MENKPDQIEYPHWVQNGSMLTNRDCLSWKNPEQTYNYVKAKFNVDPEDYGIKHPLYSQYEGKSRSELIDMIANMEQEIVNLYQYCG